MEGLISVSEAVRVSESFLITLYTYDVYKRWKDLKYKMKFSTEQEFVTWIMDRIEQQQLAEAESIHSHNIVKKEPNDEMDCTGSSESMPGLNANDEHKQVAHNLSSADDHKTLDDTTNKNYTQQDSNVQAARSQCGKNRLELIPVVNKGEICSYLDPKTDTYDASGVEQLNVEATTEVVNKQSGYKSLPSTSIGMGQKDDFTGSSSSVVSAATSDKEDHLVMVDKEDLKKLYHVETVSNADMTSGASSSQQLLGGLGEANNTSTREEPQPVIVILPSLNLKQRRRAMCRPSQRSTLYPAVPQKQRRLEPHPPLQLSSDMGLQVVAPNYLDLGQQQQHFLPQQGVRQPTLHTDHTYLTLEPPPNATSLQNSTRHPAVDRQVGTVTKTPNWIQLDF